jgi:hypothetical protein
MDHETMGSYCIEWRFDGYGAAWHKDLNRIMAHADGRQESDRFA